MDFPIRFLSDQDMEKIKLAVRLHTPIEVVSYTLPRDKEMYIQEVLVVFLRECHQEHMTDNLCFCLGELLTNSKKANTKRIYFKEHNLDINNEMDYHQGMVSFKTDMLGNVNYYLAEQKKAGLYVKLILQLNDDGIKIEIRNNSIVNVFETKRINEKLRASRRYTDPKQVISHVIDQTEGAGLGIIIIVLMLQKIGLSHENFKVFPTQTETITQMLLPLNREMNSMMDLLYDEFVGGLNTIPVFGEVVKEYAALTADSANDDSVLIDFISRDVTLASLVLKETALKGNSCSKISTAFEKLGRQTVAQLLSAQNPGIRQISKDKDVKRFWDHEATVAFYAYNFAVNYKKEHPESAIDEEEVYVCALLHDIECLLLEVATEEQKASVKKIADRIENGDKIYDLFLEDFGHSRGCYKLAQKWGLPETVAQVIHYHNNPVNAPEAIKEIVALVYLADIIQYYRQQKVEFYQINEDVRKLLHIENKQALDYIISLVDKDFPSISA